MVSGSVKHTQASIVDFRPTHIVYYRGLSNRLHRTPSNGNVDENEHPASHRRNAIIGQRQRFLSREGESVINRYVSLSYY